ncbi:MAG: helix-turn-helix domain-containing protein [Clostridia bacterium]|nr:helix-turn-helix domain-containing protein [Clostridia bacterium]
MNFTELIDAAKNNNFEVFEIILKMYMPLIRKESIINGIFDEDLYQEQCMALNNCIQKFRQ